MTPPSRAAADDRPLVERYDAVLFDLDGVLYVGPDAVPGAGRVVTTVRSRGIATAYVTNNASRTPESVALHLAALGIPARAEDVVTSAQAVARLVADAVPAGAPVLVIGAEGLHAAVEERGLRPVTKASDRPAAVVQGFGPDVGWRLLAEGTYAVRAGVPWYASNLDATVPTADGLAPGNGALVDVIAAATGTRPLAVAGKPEPPLLQEAVRRAGSTRPLMVGDRLDTDIEGANRVGADSLLVLTGVTDLAGLLRAPERHRPTYVAVDLASGLLSRTPALRRDDGATKCGGWTAEVVGDDVRLTGAGAESDGLRALCATVWASGVTVSSAEAEKLREVLRASSAAEAGHAYRPPA